MLVLFETPAGFALFKVLDEGKLSKVEVIVVTLVLITIFLPLLGFSFDKVLNFFLLCRTCGRSSTQLTRLERLFDLFVLWFLCRYGF